MPDNGLTSRLPFFAGQNSPGAAAVRAKEQDVQLVERVANGDETAFAEFYRKFSPMVHGVVLARVRREDVDDIVQEVFLSAFRSIHSLREHGAVGGWLAMIARNKAAEFYRREKPSEELPEDLPERTNPRSEAHEILDVLRSLPEAYREPLILRLVEGMSGQEIADRTNLTPESVRVNLCRGMVLLRQKLGIEERKR